jgi:hypothetical protein
VLVDGKPVKDLLIKLHPPDETENTLVPHGQTDANGDFRITSYIGGDGAPRRKYKVTVEWLTYQPLGNRWVGPNKLVDKYGDAQTTPLTADVIDKPVELPVIKVEAKPGQAVPK